MQKSDSVGELAAALSRLQGELKAPKKEAVNPFFRSKYADLAAIWDCGRKPLSDNGLAVCQVTRLVEDGMVLETILLHTSGEWISGEYLLAPTKADPQGIGAALTYARRYALCAILGIQAEDDDGEAATSPGRNSDEPKGAAPPRKARQTQGEMSVGQFRYQARQLGYETDINILAAWRRMGTQYECESVEQWTSMYDWEEGVKLLKEHRDWQGAADETNDTLSGIPRGENRQAP